MTASLLLNDVLRWSLQIAVLSAIGVGLTRLLPLRIPRVRLAFLQLVLLISLLLPALRPWKSDSAIGSVNVTTAIVAIQPDATTKHSPFAVELALLALIAAGTLMRFGFLLSGLVRLRRYGLQSQPLEPASPWGVEADLRISEEVSGPVTFGFRKPVVLLPIRFLALVADMQDAILCHEVLHVRRHDWLYTVAEELVRALLWFHPAIWWLLREIQLVREQAVDREVVEMTRSRDSYIDALLVIAGAPQPDLAPAPLFLRKRHLKQRVASILKEVRMSTAKSVSAFAAGLGLLAASCWFITSALPLYAAPQIPNDPAGVSVDTRGADLMHRETVAYPPEAVAKGIQGTVVANVKLDPAGNVTDATIVSGPEELRKAVLQSLLNWHFTRDSAALSTREVSISFALPQAGKVVQATGRLAPPVAGDRVVRSINVVGLSDAARQQLMSQLPVAVGDTITSPKLAELSDRVIAFDNHLGVAIGPVSATEVDIMIVPERVGAIFRRGPQAEPLAATLPVPDAQRIGGNVMASQLVTQVKPVYPPLAKAARVQGTVSFQATIGKDGAVQNLQLLSGPPLLVQSAMEAVQQWVYRPTLINGNPTTVVTQIDVNYTLSE